MRLNRRLTVLFVLAAIGAGTYLLARRYSTDLVAYVVVQTLLQKAPPEVDRAGLERQFARYMARAQGREERLQRLMDFAARLEKVQRLDSSDIARLMGDDQP